VTARPMAKAWAVLARRVYATLFWCALAFAVGLPAYVLVGRVHDRVVVQRDVDCYERELAALKSASTAADGCQIAAEGTDPGFWVSKSGWGEHRLVDLRPSDTVLLLIGFIVFAGVPLVVLVAARALYRRLTASRKPAR
jgi:hypothetical protein